jgi:hypothetical protein
MDGMQNPSSEILQQIETKNQQIRAGHGKMQQPRKSGQKIFAERMQMRGGISKDSGGEPAEAETA